MARPQSTRILPTAVLFFLLLATPAWAGDSLGLGTNRPGLDDRAEGTLANPSGATRSLLKLSRTSRRLVFDDPDCQESSSGSLFDLSCSAVMSIVHGNTPEDLWQVVGFDVLVWNRGTNGGPNAAPTRTGDAVGVASRAVKWEGDGTATALFLASTLLPPADPSGVVPRNRLLGGEIRLENWSEKDCAHDPLTGIPACMGFLVATSGTPGSRRGTGIVAWDGEQLLNSLATCGGHSIAPDRSCFEDYSNSESSLRIGGTHEHGIDMTRARLRGSALRAPSWAPIVWGKSNTIGIVGDEEKGELWIGGVPILHSLSDGKASGKRPLCIDLATRRVELC